MAESSENIFYIYINGDFSYNPNFDLFINKILSSFEQAMEKFKEKGVFLKVKILLVYSNEAKKNNRYMTNNLFSFSTTSNINNNNKTTESEDGFKLKPLEMNVHKLICHKLKRKNEDISNNAKLIFEFYEIIDDTNKKEPKKNKYRKSILTYQFTKNKNDINPDYLNLMYALAKKNYLNKMFDKETIKTNKIRIKLLQFFGHKKLNDAQKDKNLINNDKNENIKERYENGLEAEIVSEEKTELVKLFETQFLKGI